MSILIFNCGSSSIKTTLFKELPLTRIFDIRIENIGDSTANIYINDQVQPVRIKDHVQAMQAILKALSISNIELNTITSIGHRVVHGGEIFTEPTEITTAVENTIDSLSRLAPLHNPNCLLGIHEARKVFSNIPHIAVFDTAFHATLPTRSKIYALPKTLTSKLNIRRFGFHGISHDFVSNAAVEYLGAIRQQLRIISCHLGNGCSITAIESGRSIDTSMGMTPLEGLVMGSRSGDLDPGIIIQLLHDEKLKPIQLDQLLNQQSGLLGMTGSHNMVEIEQRAAQGDDSCRRAIQVFTHRLRKYIGAYTAVMGGVDLIIFTGGIGENSQNIRHRVAQRFNYLGAIMDDDRNRDANVTRQKPVAEISDENSRVKILVVATDEEQAMATSILAQPTQQSLASHKPSENRPHHPRTLHIEQYPTPQVPIAVSARHAHLTQATIEKLFGAGYTLTVDHPLSQPEQFACNETISIVGPRNQINNVKILGPARKQNQIEISRSDEFYLGVDAPVRPSGDSEHTPGITIIGPAGTIKLRRGLICALRHIHMHPDDAIRFNVNQGDIVDVTVNGTNRGLTFGNVQIRVDENYCLEMHIDTDEANAAELKPHDTGVLTHVDSHAKVFNPRPGP